MTNKICIITSHFPPQHSAVGDYVLRLGEALVERGRDVCVMTSAPNKEMAAKNGISILPVTNGWGIRGAWQIIKMLRQIRPCVVNLQYTPQMYNRYGITLTVAALPLAICLFLRLPVVTTCHEFLGSTRTPKEAFLQVFYSLQTLLILAGSTRVIVPIERYMEIIEQYYRPFAGKVRLVPVGSNIPAPAQISTKADASRQENWTIATLGTGHIWWNYEFALQAASLILKKGYKIRLTCIGGIEETNPHYFARLRSFAERLGLDGCVSWTGYRTAEDVSSFLSGADAFLFTQVSGPTMRSGALMAALSHGLPVVAVQGGDTDKYLLESGAIMFVSGDAPDEAASKIEALFSDDQLRRRLAGEAQELYKKKFSWDIIARQYDEIFG